MPRQAGRIAANQETRARPIASPGHTSPAEAISPGADSTWTGHGLEAIRRLLLKDAVAYGAPIALFAAGLAAQLMSMLHHDPSWYLIAGAQYLEGGILYRDVFVDVNPPLGLFLTLPPVILARFLDVFPVPVFVVYVYLLIALSLAAAWRLLDGPPVLRRGLFIAAAAVLILSPAGDFGQREHFLTILILPYLFLSALDPARKRIPWMAALILGLAAGAGFALKPHYLLIPLALEVYRLTSVRRLASLWRPEVLGLGLALLGYGGVLIFVTPDYLTRIVPYAMEVYNQAYANPLYINLFRLETFLLPLGCAIQIATRRRQAAPRYGDVFLIASACLFVAYLVQGKGWDYHLYPASACLVLGYVSICLNAMQRQNGAASPSGKGGLSHGAALAALAVAAVLVGHDVTKFGYKNRFTEIMTPYAARYAGGGSIAVMSANLWAGFPLVNNSRLGWSSRFAALWLLPGAQQRRHADDGADLALLDEMEAFTRDAVVADFTAAMPDLVFVDDRDMKPYFGGLSFDYLEFFGQDRRFARIWPDYVWVEKVVGFDIYRRRCAPGC